MKEAGQSALRHVITWNVSTRTSMCSLKVRRNRPANAGSIADRSIGCGANGRRRASAGVSDPAKVVRTALEGHGDQIQRCADFIEH